MKPGLQVKSQVPVTGNGHQSSEREAWRVEHELYIRRRRRKAQEQPRPQV